MSGTTFSKLPVMIVALVIGLILTFTAVMPLVSDYSDAKTFKNEGYFYVDKFDETTTFVYENSTLKINGEDVTLPTPNTTTPYGNSISIAFTDNGVIRYIPNDGNLLIRGVFGNHNCSALNLTFTGGSFTGTYTSTTSSTGTITGTYSELTMIQNTGENIMCYTSGSYIKGDSVIDGCGFTSLPNNSDYVVIHISGTYDGGISVDVCAQNDGSTTDYVVSNIQIDASPVSGFIDLYRLSKITFTVTDEDSAKSDNVTYNIYTVPSEVTADPDNPTAYKNLVSVLPLFALILLVAGAASLVYFKNKD